ncbi:MAG: DegT/DnrJ/EryC1/StrS family aminotransferase, partial [Phycisphaerae bacterium]|nr:DegT/DnrJ/EryC1/StrS family aminotransferase [Phycisphaerae bacterium]
AAIHLAVGAINPDPGDEIITAPITDLGSVVPILIQNAIPVFADADPATMNMTPEAIEATITERTRGIIAVHLFGNACEIDGIRKVARRHKIPLIEDCSQAHATRYKGKYLGTYGDISAFSLQQSKHMTTGDGGIAITNNARYARRMKAFQDKGWVYSRFARRDYQFLAPNYRFNELQAAVALEQLKKVRGVTQRRMKLGRLLSRLIAKAPGVLAPAVTAGSEHTYWLYPLRIVGGPVKAFCKALEAEGVWAWPNYIEKPIFLCASTLTKKNTYGVSHCPFACPAAEREYEYVDGMCPGAEEGLNHVAPIALHEHYTEEDVRDVGRAICKVAWGLYG